MRLEFQYELPHLYISCEFYALCTRHSFFLFLIFYLAFCLLAVFVVLFIIYKIIINSLKKLLGF